MRFLLRGHDLQRWNPDQPHKRGTRRAARPENVGRQRADGEPRRAGVGPDRRVVVTQRPPVAPAREGPPDTARRWFQYVQGEIADA